MKKKLILLSLFLLGVVTVFAEPRGDAEIIKEKRFQLSGLTIEGYSESDQVLVAVAPFDFEGTILDDQEVETIRSLFSAALVNSYSFGVLDRDYIDAVMKEQSFQLSGLTDQDKTVEAGQFLGVQGIFIGTLKEENTSYSLHIRFIAIDLDNLESDKLVYEFTTNPFKLNQIDTYMESLVLHITTEMGIRIPAADFNTGLIIGVKENLKTAIINIGSENIDPSMGIGVQKNFIYVLYLNNKEISRGLVAEVSPYSSVINFTNELPADILSNPGYKLVLFGYLPMNSFRFWGPFGGTFSGDVGFETGFSIQYMSDFNVSLDLYLGIGAPLLNPDPGEYSPLLFTPVGITYHFRNLNTFTIGLGIGLGIILTNTETYNESLNSTEIDTNYSFTPSFYAILIPNGRRTSPGARTSSLQFAPIVRIMPIESDWYWSFCLGVSW